MTKVLDETVCFGCALDNSICVQRSNCSRYRRRHSGVDVSLHGRGLCFDSRAQFETQEFPYFTEDVVECSSLPESSTS